jgi:hypothetical protein
MDDREVDERLRRLETRSNRSGWGVTLALCLWAGAAGVYLGENLDSIEQTFVAEAPAEDDRDFEGPVRASRDCVSEIVDRSLPEPVIHVVVSYGPIMQSSGTITTGYETFTGSSWLAWQCLEVPPMGEVTIIAQGAIVQDDEAGSPALAGTTDAPD